MSQIPIIVRHHVFEGTTAVEVTHTFPVHIHKIILTNDDNTDTLLFKFNAIDDFATLQPGEIFELDIQTETIIVNTDGNPVAFRAWGYS